VFYQKNKFIPILIFEGTEEQSHIQDPTNLRVSSKLRQTL
jgi:hypothetical protein